MTSQHSRHDRLLIVRFAGDDAYPNERAKAESLVAGCDECAALAADIRLLQQRTVHMPPPRRPRDFRISVEQAEALRGSWFQRAMRRLVGPGLGTLRPVAGAALAIGLTMTAAGSLPMSGGAAAPAQDDRAPLGMPGATAAMEQQQPEASDMGMPAGEAVPDVAHAEGEIRSADGTPMPMSADTNKAFLGDGIGAGDAYAGAPAAQAASSNPLVYIGLLIATTALAVLLLAVVVRRRYADPLLR